MLSQQSGLAGLQPVVQPVRGCCSGLRRHSLNSHINNVQAFQAGCSRNQYCSCTCKTFTMSKYSATVRFQEKSWINLPNKTSVGGGAEMWLLNPHHGWGGYYRVGFCRLKSQACRPDWVAMPSLQGPSVVSVVTVRFFFPHNFVLRFHPGFHSPAQSADYSGCWGGGVGGGGGDWMPLHSHEAHWLLIEQTQASLILLILMGNDYIWPERHGGPSFHDSKRL